MKRANSTVIGAGLTVFVILTVSSSPAFSACVKKNPIFGFDTYMDDKYCKNSMTKKKSPKKAAMKRKAMKKKNMAKKTVKARTRPTAMVKKTRRVATSSSAVKEMQTLLAGMGYDPGPIDGYKGPQTKQAAMAFKKSVGLRMGTDTEETVEVLKRISGK